MLESLNYSFRNPKKHNLSNLPHQTVEKLQKNHGVLWGPQVGKQRWRARLGILRFRTGFPRYRGFTITLRHITLSRTPLEKGSARCSHLHLITQNTHKRKTTTQRRDSNPKSQQESVRVLKLYAAKPQSSARLFWITHLITYNFGNPSKRAFAFASFIQPSHSRRLDSSESLT